MRGLTLIEVLVSIALLAAIASAILPWMTDTRRMNTVASLPITPEALGDLADAVLADPASFGLPPVLDIGSAPTPIQTIQTHLTVRRVDASRTTASHA